MAELRYRVEIDGDPEALERLPGLLRGQDFDIHKDSEGNVLLTGGVFEACADPDEVIEEATHVLRRLGSLLKVFAAMSGDLKVKHVQWKNEQNRWKRRLIARFALRVVSYQGLEELGAPAIVNSTLGSAILRLGSLDDDVARALDLIAGRTIGWHELYDLIDVMGNIDGIVQRRWATRSEMSRIRRTANHYRHRGSAAANDKLPDDPPSLTHAWTVVIGLFRRWLAERLAAERAGCGTPD